MPRLSHIPFLFLIFLNTVTLTAATISESQSEDMSAPRLPPSGQDRTQLDLSNGHASLGDQLGPLVINKDGTTARITNWQEMTDNEKETTMRIVTKRNRARLAAIKEQENDRKGEL